MPSEVCPASGCLAVRAGTPELYPLDLHQRLRNPMTRKWHQMPVSQLLNTAWMTCLLTWWRAGCKEDIQDIDLWAKIPVEAELQVSGSRCARCKCCWVAVILLFSISVFLCIGIWAIPTSMGHLTALLKQQSVCQAASSPEAIWSIFVWCGTQSNTVHQRKAGQRLHCAPGAEVLGSEVQGYEIAQKRGLGTVNSSSTEVMTFQWHKTT